MRNKLKLCDIYINIHRSSLEQKWEELERERDRNRGSTHQTRMKTRLVD